MRRRREWEQMQPIWDLRHWRLCIFSDGPRISLDHKKQRERLIGDCIQPTHRNRGPSVWSGMHPSWREEQPDHPGHDDNWTYRQLSNIRRTKSQHIKYSRTVLRLSVPNPLKPDVKSKNEDVVGAAPTGDAPTTSDWSTIVLPTKVRLILDVFRYLTST